ncbi:MAG: LexA family transcriptional regulator [Paludibacteraceae bacterium]|nr:LexA family transcriptional regulator [Paludibacteraceae bacterium]
MLSSQEVLHQLLAELDMSVKSFADSIGYSSAKIHDLKRGKTRRFSDDLIAHIVATYPVISRIWLMTGEGNMYGKPSTDINQQSSTGNQQHQNMLPLIPIDAVAGYNGIDSMGVLIEDCTFYSVPEFIAAKAEYMIRVSGSSMYPKYSSGDILACRRVPEITFFQWGKVYVIDSNQGAMVKRLFEVKEDPTVVLCKSDNNNYPPFVLPKKEIRSLSIVVGVIRLE